jgi:DNA-binding protein HU-beta
MAKQMTKSQIADSLAKEHSLTKKSAVAILESVVALAYKEAKNGFTIPGLGKLVLVQRKARIGRNPQTGESIKIPAKKVIKFRVAKAAKDAVLGAKKK